MNEQALIEQEAELIEKVESLELELRPMDDKARLGIMVYDELEDYLHLYRQWMAARKLLHAVNGAISDIMYGNVA